MWTSPRRTTVKQGPSAPREDAVPARVKGPNNPVGVESPVTPFPVSTGVEVSECLLSSDQAITQFNKNRKFASSLPQRRYLFCCMRLCHLLSHRHVPRAALTPKGCSSRNSVWVMRLSKPVSWAVTAGNRGHCYIHCTDEKTEHWSHQQPTEDWAWQSVLQLGSDSNIHILTTGPWCLFHSC